MITPGLYKHYKGGDYRVLFVAQWWDPSTKLVADAIIHVVPSMYGVGLVTRAINATFMTALWSGNVEDVRYKDDIVAYVGLYGYGRVAARTLAEFEQRTGGDLDVPRFERIGD